MEITWYGQTCVRLRGRDAVVVADAYQSVVGPTGRGITADIATYSHADDAPLARAKGRKTRDGKTVLPSSLESTFTVDGPGEYEVKDVLLTGVRTYRDDQKGGLRGRGVAFVVELDGLHTIHLGDVGHLLTEEKLGDIGSVDIACVPVGGTLSPTRVAVRWPPTGTQAISTVPMSPSFSSVSRWPMSPRWIVCSPSSSTTNAVPRPRTEPFWSSR